MATQSRFCTGVASNSSSEAEAPIIATFTHSGHYGAMPIMDLNPTNPLVDGRQSARALEIRRGLARHFRDLGVALISELPLASGRRADLMGMDGRGRFVIVEIKSSIEDYRADSKWPDYLAHCDSFFFATHPEVPADIFPTDHGLIVADSYGAEVLRSSVECRMAGATRKALMLRFARAAAQRLDRILVHHDVSGLNLPGNLHEIDGS